MTNYLSKSNKHIQWIIQDIIKHPEKVDRLRFEVLPEDLREIRLKTFLIYCSFARTHYLVVSYKEKES